MVEPCLAVAGDNHDHSWLWRLIWKADGAIRQVIICQDHGSTEAVFLSENRGAFISTQA